MDPLVATDNGANWLTDIINSTANAYATIKQADALKSQQLGQTGYYLNGQFVPNGSQSQSVPMGLLLLGGAVLLFVLLEK